MGYNSIGIQTPNLRNTMTKTKNDRLFRAECSKICKVHVKSWDNYVGHGYIKEDGVAPGGKRWYFRSTVLAFKKKLITNRKPGYPFFIGQSSSELREANRKAPRKSSI